MRAPHFILAFVLILLCAVPLAGKAQTPPRSQQVQDALARGFAMAQQKQWRLAIKYFKRAHQGAATDPAVLLNLALAYDKAGGRELIAAAWFKAFLAAAPKAKNAAAVRKRIIELDTQTKIQIQKIIDTMTSSITQLPKNANKSSFLDLIGQINALAGNLSVAKQTVSRAGKTPKKFWAPAYIASAQAQAGNFSAARKSASSIKWKRAQAWALADIAVIQASKKDIAGALVTAGGIRSKHETTWAYSRIAALQARTGDATGAQATLAKIDKKRNAHHTLALAAVAEGLARTGDTANAFKFMTQAQKEISTIKDFQDRLNATLQVVRAQAALKDFKLAESTAAQMPESYQKYSALRSIAEAQGNIGGAEIYRWTTLAVRAEGNPNIGDIGSLLKSAKGKSMADSITALGKASGARSRLLHALRNPN